MSSQNRILFLAVAVFIVAGFSIALGWNSINSVADSEISYSRAGTSSAAAINIPKTAAREEARSMPPSPITHKAVAMTAGHIQTPESVHAIYMSQCMAGSPRLRKTVIDFVETSDLNAIIIDIKDFSGGISFPTDDPALAPYVSHSCGANDMKDLVFQLHAKGIYVIGRITVFQDPTYVKAHPELAVKTKEGGIWKNYGGIPFIDVGAKPFWDYIVELSKVSYGEIGFDELNYDYIRFPSDGPLSDADYTFDKGKTKTEAVTGFFKYIHSELHPLGIPMSADMFGMVSSHEDDLGIGQVLDSALPYFDFIDPMVYPSHYPKGFNGYSNVNDHVYDIVYSEMKHASARAVAAGYEPSKIRPWLQSFDYPVSYTPAMVQAQIKANHDAGLDSYLFWDAANKYVSLRKVLQ
jgi:hypothetical protein